MNVSQLQPSVAPPLHTTSGEASEKDADFLALRLLNKRARVRLSPEPIDLAPLPGKGHLFTVANSRGWFAAIIRDSTSGASLILSPLADLRNAYSAATAENDQTVFSPQRKVPLDTACPNMISFASRDSRLLIGLTQGSILVFNTDDIFSAGEGPISPLHNFPSTSSSAPVSVLPNPGDLPELVAVLWEPGNNSTALLVEVLDVQNMQSVGGWQSGNSPDTTPTSLSWSPKGKQLAIGLQSGNILTFSPTSTSSPKSIIPRPPSASNSSVISNTWLANPSFHAIYAPQGPSNVEAEQSHFIVSSDSKVSTAHDVKLNDPYMPFPGLRPPGAFLLVLKNWDPARFLLFIGNSCSSDIGAIGNIADEAGEAWYNLSLEETSTPSLPLDKDMNDTVLIGLELDLTCRSSYRHTNASGEGIDLPPPPVMYAYASDGTLIGWNILNVRGTPYPGMVTENVQSLAISAVAPTPKPQVTAPPQTSISPTVAPSTFGQPSSFGQTPASSNSPIPMFGQQPVSAFGQQPVSAFGQSSFGQANPAFNKQSFGTSSFGQQSSPFGQPSPSGFGTTTSAGGFGAFSSAAPAQFGQAGFGFGKSPTENSTPAEDNNMASDDTPSFGGLSLGDSSSQPEKPKSTFGSTFGHASTTPSPPITGGGTAGSESSFGFGSGFIKPATGFGAFGNVGSTNAFGSASSASATESSNPESGSGKGGFGSGASTGFGQSGFNQSSFGQSSFGKSSFGQTSFGQSGFGQPGFGQKETSAFGKTAFGAAAPASPAVHSQPASGGFGSFASGGPTTFGSALQQTTTPTKPAWAADDGTAKPLSEPFKPVFEESKSGTTGDKPALASGTAPQTETTSTNDREMSFGQNLTTPVSVFTSSSASLRNPSPSQVESRSPSPVEAKDETPNITTPFKSSSPSPAAGAFGQLQTSPSPFYRPATGFGFGGEPAKNSPFFNPPKQPESKPVSVFTTAATTPTSTPPKSGAGTPTFGMSSTIGSALKPATPSAPSPATSAFTTPASGAFSAFANSGGFGAFSGGAKSFGELLRTGGDEVKDPSKERASSVLKLSEREDSDPKPALPTIPQHGKSISIVAPQYLDNNAPSEESYPSPTDDSRSKEIVKEGKEKESISQKSSLASIPSSADSSFVEVNASSDECEDQDGALSEEGELEDDTKSFISESVSESEDDELPEEESGESETEQLDDTKNGTFPSTPQSNQRSPSTTPKNELPAITLPTSPSPSSITSDPGSGKLPMPLRETSTTPPGSPSKETSTVSLVPSAPPTQSTPTTSPFGLPFRPSTRPTRSSPLASVPLTGEDEEVEPKPVLTASKSAPSTTTLHPAPAKSPFGQFTPPVKMEEPDATSALRPKTPPLLSTFGIPASKPPAPFNIAPTSLQLAPPQFSLPKAPSLFPSSTPPSLFGTKPKLPEAMPTTPRVFGSQVKAPVTPSVPIPEPQLEQGMQTECAYLFSSLAKELENLRVLAEEAGKKKEGLRKRSNHSFTKTDLVDPQKWTMGDVQQYGRVLAQLQDDVKNIKDQRILLKRTLRELESNMLKAGTRKEEIVRFNRAKTDEEFAKMLKVRTLGPEHLEAQSQLRRDIQAVRDRVQKLEDNLQGCKTKLSQFKIGKPGLRAPSLDTVNRTFRNINLAINQQTEDISKLAARMSKLDMSSLQVPITRDKRLGESTSKRPINVTPHVAVTTAAALNAERSAQKLKRALLEARSEPLLNTSVAKMPAPTFFHTPQKAVKMEPQTSPSLFSLPTTPVALSLPSALSPWPSSPSEDDSASSHLMTSSRHRTGSGVKHHQKPVQLKKGPNPGGPSSPVTFDWGPVPSITPMKTLSADVRQKNPK